MANPSRHDLATNEVFPSLVRAPLLWGVEQRPAILIILTAIACVAAYRPNPVTYPIAALLVLGVIPWLRSKCRRDPQAITAFLQASQLPARLVPRTSAARPRRPFPSYR